MYNVCTIWKSYPSKTMAEMSDFWYFVLSLFYSVYTMVHNATHKEKSSTNTTAPKTILLEPINSQTAGLSQRFLPSVLRNQSYKSLDQNCPQTISFVSDKNH